MNNEFDWHDEIEAEIVGYTSPIEVIMRDIQNKIDGDCLKVVHNYGFNVDKDELAKALKYDRDQYIKGFNDAKKMFERPQGEWKKHPNGFKEWDVCSCCGIGCKRREINDKDFVEYNYPFCPNCGASMKSKPSFYNTNGLTDEEEINKEVYEDAMSLDDDGGRNRT